MPDAALGQRVVRVLRSWHEARPRTHSDQCDGISCDYPVLVDGRIPTQEENFETWLSWMAEPQPFLNDADNARRQALYQDLTSAIAFEMDSAIGQAFERETPPEWLTSLVMRWHQLRQDIVTFNYDTVIKASVDHLQISEPVEGRGVDLAKLAPREGRPLQQFDHPNDMA